MKNQMQLGFSYERLDSETRVVVEQRTEEIRELVRKTAQDIYRNSFVKNTACWGRLLFDREHYVK
jgi:hypothetical protein